MALLEIAKGSTLFLLTTLTKNGLPMPLPSGVRVLFVAKINQSDADSAAVALLDNQGLGGVIFTDPVNGVVQTTMAPYATYSLPVAVQQLYYEIWVQDVAGNEFRADKGTIKLTTRILVQQLSTFIPAIPQGPIRYVNATGLGVPGALASPYNASAGDRIVVGTNLGSVVINLPILTPGTFVNIAHDPSTSIAVNTITVNAPGGVSISRPQPDNGTFTAPGGSVVFPYVPLSGPTPTPSDSVGFSVKWYNGSAANGAYLLE